jgi:hypothetical protein
VKAAKKAKRPAKASVEKVLVLRTCAADGTAHGGFQWPRKGLVSAPDWSPEKVCGQGLHGLLWGDGDPSLLNWNESALWLVVEVEKASIVDLGRKVKFPAGTVIFCGDAKGAAAIISARAPVGTKVIHGTATAGDSGTATAGHSGTATAGDSGTATAGDSGTATAGHRGTATAGDSGTATAGDSGTARTGDLGVIAIRWYDPNADRYRVAIGYVGEDGIKANTFYVADGAGKLVERESTP